MKKKVSFKENSALRICALKDGEGEKILLPPNMPLQHKDYFELVIFKELQMQEKMWKPVSFLREIYIYEGTLHCVSLSVPERGWLML